MELETRKNGVAERIENKTENKLEAKLETRTCTTKGCTRTFRVLISSKQTICSNSCAQGPYPEAAKSKPVKPQPVTQAKPPAEVEA